MRDEEFERLYAEHAQPLFGFLVYRTGDRAFAEDVLTDTFVRVLAAKQPFDSRRGTEKAWLYTIALNLLRDRGRRSAAEGRALEQATRVARAANPVSPISALEEADAIQRALGVLSTEEREVIALRFGADLTAPEIAEVIGLPLTTVEGRVYRALRKLRDELA